MSLSETLTSMIESLGFVYFIIALPIFAVCALPWLAIRRCVQVVVARRVAASFLLAVPFAPCLFAIGTAGLTVPALFVIAVGLGVIQFGSPTSWEAFWWTLPVLSIVVLWAIIFGIWTLISFCRIRLKDIAPNNPDAPVPAGAPELKTESRRRGAGDPQR